jgi:hypothetical protein
MRAAKPFMCLARRIDLDSVLYFALVRNVQELHGRTLGGDTHPMFSDRDSARLHFLVRKEQFRAPHLLIFHLCKG